MIHQEAKEPKSSRAPPPAAAPIIVVKFEFDCAGPSWGFEEGAAEELALEVVVSMACDAVDDDADGTADELLDDDAKELLDDDEDDDGAKELPVDEEDKVLDG